MRVGTRNVQQVAKLKQKSLRVCPFGWAGGRPVRNKILNIPIRHGGNGSKGSAAAASARWMRQPFCDESGVGFAACLAEKPTALWSHHSILRSDETWLPEWSGNLGGVQRWRSSVARASWGKPVFRLTASSQLAESLARGRVQIQRDGTSTQTEARLTRNGGCQV
jgi:hypothetical protein